MRTRDSRRRATAAIAAIASLTVVSGAEGATPVPPQVQATIDQAQAKPLYEGSDFGLRVVDQDTGEVLIDENPNQLFVPGSIMKTFTTSAALGTYGADYHFRTPVHRTGKVRDGRLQGDLVLVGSGDYSFGLRERPNGTLGYNSTPQIDHNYGGIGLPGPTILADSHPLAGVEDLARQVRKAGIREVAGDVIIDDRLFEKWESPDGLIAPIWVNENVIDMEATPTTPGKRAKLRWRPKTDAIRVVNRVKTGPAGTPSSLSASGPGGRRRDDQGERRGRRRAGARHRRDSRPGVVRAHGVHRSARGRRSRRVRTRHRGQSKSATAARQVASAREPGGAADLPRPALGVRQGDPQGELQPPAPTTCSASSRRSWEVPTASRAWRPSGSCTRRSESIPRACTSSTAPARATRTGSRLLPQRPSSETSSPSPTGRRSSTACRSSASTACCAKRVSASPAAGFIHAKDGARAYGGGSSPFDLLGARTRIGYIQAASGRRLVYADFVNNVVAGAGPKVDETINEINLDQSTIESAIQQGY